MTTLRENPAKVVKLLVGPTCKIPLLTHSKELFRSGIRRSPIRCAMWIRGILGGGFPDPKPPFEVWPTGQLVAIICPDDIALMAQRLPGARFTADLFFFRITIFPQASWGDVEKNEKNLGNLTYLDNIGMYHFFGGATVNGWFLRVFPSWWSNWRRNRLSVFPAMDLIGPRWTKFAKVPSEENPILLSPLENPITQWSCWWLKSCTSW